MEEKFLTPKNKTISDVASIPPKTQQPQLSLRSMYTILALIIGIVCGIGGLLGYQEYMRTPEVTSFEACIKTKGSTIQESYPATCITKDGKRFIQPIEPTICPKDEWVDCMPGPDPAGIKLECTDTYLSWAKANCPNFKGAAL